MIDAYKHNPPEIDSIISSLKLQLNVYNEKISELENLIKKIESSSAWIDAVLKTSFLSSCNSYIKIYQNVYKNIEKSIEYITKKSEYAVELENSFLR